MGAPLQPAVEAVSLITLAVAIFGPQAGPYVVIALGSIGGGLWALSDTPLQSRKQGVWLMVRCVLTAIMLTALAATYVGPWVGQPVTEVYGLVAFIIGMLGNRWRDIIESIKTRIQTLISTTGGPKP